MLICNHTRQIYVPYESVTGFVLSYRADDLNEFFNPSQKAEGDKRERPVELVVYANAGALTFTERYGSKGKADEAMASLIKYLENGRQLFVFPIDEEYEVALAEAKAKKEALAKQQRPAYAQEVSDGQGE